MNIMDIVQTNTILLLQLPWLRVFISGINGTLSPDNAILGTPSILIKEKHFYISANTFD